MPGTTAPESPSPQTCGPTRRSRQTKRGKDRIIFVTKEDHETPSNAELVADDPNDPYEEHVKKTLSGEKLLLIDEQRTWFLEMESTSGGDAVKIVEMTTKEYDIKQWHGLRGLISI
ncbi:mitochondrial intermembrane space import and assembly protein 40 isoform X3 [Zalophus californianus]|uniref:Mitochondrial intermembrane space import and assembly protein 40 isoform X3 n=1 Tax=Zalophus californianus TaxID=9704 RepID=A0A6J2C3C3_ZALCA|nr:mitochondrial intermembrane space import and assembly protein 40 isoform X3 [Zalophus californianus]